MKTGANTIHGVKIANLSKLSMLGNIIDGFDYGIHLIGNVDLDGSLIANNLIQNCITYGVRWYAQNLVISNNIMKNNGTDYSAEGQTNVSLYYQLDTNRWYDNGQSVTRGTAAPTTGTWAVGDICWKTNAAAAGTPGWVCTTAGTPGTWTAMANLAA